MKATTDIDQRHTLIPTIVKTLRSLNHPEKHRHIQERLTEHGEWCNGSPEWIEQKLWTTLTQVLGKDHSRSRKSLLTDSRDKRACSRLQQDSSLVTACHVSSLPVDVSKLSQNMTTATDVAAGDSHPAYQSYTNPVGNMCKSSIWSAGQANFDNWLTGEARHAHSAHAVSHEAGTSPEIDMEEDIIGQKQLTHNLQSFSCWHHQDPDLFESIDIYRDARPFKYSSNQDSTTETINREQAPFCSERDINTSFSSTAFSTIPNAMDSQISMQSLSELLGDDSRLESMWKRRRSTCPTGEDYAEQLHNMFVHDPDMKLFSPARKDSSSSSDTMILDNYDFSRASSCASTYSTPATLSRSSFEQLESSSYSQPTHISRKKQSSSRKQSSNSRTLEDDILFQQSSASRSVDIKKRKDPREYSSRH